MNSWRTRFLWSLLTVAVLAGTAWLAVAQNSHQSYLPAVIRGPISGGSPVVKINFQPAGVDIPPDYLPDTGATFGDRGNGFSYGWNADNSAATRDRNSPLAFDQRYDTLIHLQREENPDAVWEIALPPGVYDVYAVGGDPEAFHGYMQSLAEGQMFVNGAPNEGQRFISGIATAVVVTDGRLTIRSGPATSNNKLNFVEIYKLADMPTPPPPPPETVEFRGLWVTRFDWTRFNTPADPAKIDEIVNNAADAGFNAIFFQVRAIGDAYYASTREPWAQRVSGGDFGQPPSPHWDPLAYFVERAHERGIQLHAYVNVYPVWDSCVTTPPEGTNPQSPYYLLRHAHGMTDDKLDGLQWTTQRLVSCGQSNPYLYATPASAIYRTHFKSVVADLVNRYDIDGIHLDRVRYAGRSTSCDPVSEQAFGDECFTGDNMAYEDWQREQVNTLVRLVYDEVIVPARRDVWLSAAVWPTYLNKWGWASYSQGYHDYYQDSHAWVRDGYIDALAPMTYSYTTPPENNPFRMERWQVLIADFQANRGGRHIIAGIGAIGPNLLSFEDVVERIEAARQLGTAGHAIYSYGALLENGYFDDLAAGPYATPASVPVIPWHD